MRVYFDGSELTERFLVSDVSRPIAGNRVETADVPGRDGTMVKSVGRAAGSVSFTLWPHLMDDRALRRAVREVSALMAVDEPRRLSFSDDDGLYYMAIPDGVMEVGEFQNAFAIECHFIVPEPAMYGKERKATVPSGGSVTVRVDGTYPAKTLIKATSAVRGTGNLWGVTLDNGIHSRVKIPTGSATAVEIDAARAVTKVAGAVALMTLDSDWIELAPGTHVLSNGVGTGACTVAWTERWLS